MLYAKCREIYGLFQVSEKEEGAEEAEMKVLEERIRQEGQILSDTVLKVDSFLNHQVDTGLALEIGKEFGRIFGGRPITKVLTIEASGIQFAMAASIALSVPFVYAKKKKAVTLSEQVYSAPVHSFTRQESYQVCISQKYLGPGDKVLIVDDFLATGAALVGLVDIVREAGAELLGVGCVIEKCFQEGRGLLEEMGVEVHSLARISAMAPGEVHFIENEEITGGLSKTKDAREMTAPAAVQEAQQA
ncbi:hypothetical protein PSAB_23385 [Paenibacillus sabinae T27]|uniref:Xanthine phosphoribosyltransferase n=2 Tax=Paenibacillus TaxID=44249 RepID=X5A6Y0_9BACL|nr:hypothetical protein PSAB_23385 [Paenibacillus sabinae T27]